MDPSQIEATFRCIESESDQLASTATGWPSLCRTVWHRAGLAYSRRRQCNDDPGGAIYAARNFTSPPDVSFELGWISEGRHDYPVTFNVQAARNVGIALPERDAMLAALQVGRTTKRGDMAFLYVFSIKGANALISQFTDNDLGTGSGVNIRTHHFRFDYAFSRKVTWQSLFYMQNELRNSGQFPAFFVPLNAFTPRQYRWQEQLVFTF